MEVKKLRPFVLLVRGACRRRRGMSCGDLAGMTLTGENELVTTGLHRVPRLRVRTATTPQG